MNVRNIQIFSSTTAANGAWQDISNLVSLSVQVQNYTDGNVWVEVSNDPNVTTDGLAGASNGGCDAPAAPTLSQFAFNAGSRDATTDQYGTATAQPGSGLPAQSLSIKLTYVTRNQPVVTPIPLYNMTVGETAVGAASAISVIAGNICQVASPVKGSGADANSFATGYNVYAQIGGSGPYVLQNTRGGPNASNSYYDGPIPLGTPFNMKMGFVAGGAVAPATDQNSGSPAAGTNIQGTSGVLSTITSPASSDAPIAFIADTGSKTVVISPSSMTWKWLRVNKSGGGSPPALTQAFLCGQLG